MIDRDIVYLANKHNILQVTDNIFQQTRTRIDFAFEISVKWVFNVVGSSFQRLKKTEIQVQSFPKNDDSKTGTFNHTELDDE